MSNWNEEKIVSLLDTSDKAVERAIVAIYNRQTIDEKATNHTSKSNNIGFSGADASSGSYYAKWILSGRNLSGKHLDKARNMAKKYRKQLLSIANSGIQPNLGICDICFLDKVEGIFYEEKQIFICNHCNSVE